MLKREGEGWKRDFKYGASHQIKLKQVRKKPSPFLYPMVSSRFLQKQRKLSVTEQSGEPFTSLQRDRSTQFAVGKGCPKTRKPNLLLMAKHRRHKLISVFWLNIRFIIHRTRFPYVWIYI